MGISDKNRNNLKIDNVKDVPDFLAYDDPSSRASIEERGFCFYLKVFLVDLSPDEMLE